MDKFGFKKLYKAAFFAVISGFVMSSAFADEPSSSVQTELVPSESSLTVQKDRVRGEENEATARIINGYPVYAGDRTFQVSLQDSMGHFCGRAIIADSWVLTAAHCVDGYTVDKIVTGIYNLSETGSSFSIEKIVSHPGFDGDRLGEVPDLALIKINGIFPRQLERLKLADQSVMNSARPGVEGVVSGWGLTRGGGQLSQQLLQTTNTIISDAQCQSMDNYPISADYVICAYDGWYPQGSCNGDSGGPFTISLGGTTYSIGIVSFGPQYCDGYSAYTETAAFVDWINQNIQSNQVSCPSGYLNFEGMLGRDGTAVIGPRALGNGTLSFLNISTSASTMRLYNRQNNAWQLVLGGDKDFNYALAPGEYGVLVVGSPNQTYHVCGGVF